MGEVLHLLQAGDVSLDAPLSGIAGLPAPLQDRLADARYLAVRELVDAAVHNNVDAVAFAGNLWPMHRAGSPAPWFLWQQFSRLAERCISVLVLSDTLPTAPKGLCWPRNVVPVPSQHAVSWMTRSQQTVRVSDGRHPFDPAGVADHHLILGGELPSQQRLDHSPEVFWLCSGETINLQNSFGQIRAHACGPLQGGGFREPGPNGAWKLEISRGRAQDLRPIGCDAVRWYREELLLDAESAHDTVLIAIASRMSELHKRAGTPVVIRWALTGEGEFLDTLWAPSAQRELLQAIRNDCPPDCGVADLRVVATKEQRAEQQLSPTIAMVRQQLAELTQNDTIDLLPLCELGCDAIPNECRTLSHQRYQDRLRFPIDQRLWGELLSAVRSA